MFERFLNHGWDGKGQLNVLVKWYGCPEKKAPLPFAFSLSRKAIRKYCLRERVKLPALTCEGVLFSDQVGRQALGTLVTSSHMQSKEHKKRS